MKGVLIYFLKYLALISAVICFSYESTWALDDCSDPQLYRASNVQSISGFSRATLNQHGNLVVTIDIDADERVDRIFRIGLISPEDRQRAIAMWSGHEVELVVRVWTVSGQPIHRFDLTQFDNAFVVASKEHECLERFTESQKIAQEPVFLRTAISSHSLGELQSRSHREILSAFGKRSLFIKDNQVGAASKNPKQGEVRSGPFSCMAGGQGADSCSIEFGGFGAVTGGGCSVSGCEEPSFACCGMGLGSYCVCRSPDDGDSGGGLGGDPSGGSDGPGDSGGSDAGGGAEDECDQDDPPPSCDDDSEDEKEEIGF